MPLDLESRLHQLVSDLNKHDLDAVRDQLSSRYLESDPAPGDPDAADALTRLVSDVIGALPDLEVTLTTPEDDGDRLVGRVTLTGTHTGDLWGAPPTGHELSWDAPVVAADRGDGLAVGIPLPTPEAVVPLVALGVVPPPESRHLPPPNPVSPPELLLRLLFTGQAADKACDHLDLIAVTEPSTDVCAQCVDAGDVWPALRMCLVCGLVACCDDAKNAHMRAHHEETGHPLFRSVHLGQGWGWCYPDAAFFSSSLLDRYR